MIFSVDKDTQSLNHLPEHQFSSLGILERQDLEEWVIDEPRILGEELLVVTSEFEGFEDTADRLDVLALDTSGKLVVVELKRDKADKTTDLQAIKYASYCSTLTAEDVQKEYRTFWNTRDNEEYSPEDVGADFVEFLDRNLGGEYVTKTEDGWADFELSDKPRILLAAGEYGIEITSPVMWLIEEYGVDITCVRIEAHEHQGRILLNTQQVIPVTEAEEYMTRRRQKQEKQTQSGEYKTTLSVLLERDVLAPGDIVVFDKARVPDQANREWDPEDDFWRGRVTENRGQSDALEWLYDNELCSFTGAAKELLHELVERDRDKVLSGYEYWTHPEFEYERLYNLRDQAVTGDKRQ
ncbi:DUF91 domain-containing protein [Haloprofundus halobius]|uniref:DUF91 domain-containing protein n=1 Tax=Haloprofundus halobius TaxID=2876194 RepID=UPI001CC93CD0|nr:DUF91 domain-containing protein [Haloprofundus halobius]